MSADVPPLFRFRRPGRRLVAVVIAAASLAVGCASSEPETPAAPPDFLVLKLGGDTTAKALRGRPFNQSARNLTNAQLQTFGAGADVFDADAVPPALGPTFNATGCLGCHLDGNQDPSTVTQPPGLLIRLGSGTGDPIYGLQLQTQPADLADAIVTYRFVDEGNLARLVADVVPNHGPLAPDTTMSVRMAPPIIGLGLLEAIPEWQIRAAADPDDANGDGISGRVNEVWESRSSQLALGRFGWKAGQPSVAQQTVVAMHDDMGVTSSAEPDPCARQGSWCPAAGASRAEMSDSRLADMIFYNRTIAVPIAADVTSPAVVAGARRFDSIGCAACHIPTQSSGGSDIAANADQTFHPYTDLLVHDMGVGLADGRAEADASGSEWRTAPLWGIGRRFGVWGIHAYLHDGRARSIDEAIRWHGGEGERSRLAFEGLTDQQRQELLAFLDSL